RGVAVAPQDSSTTGPGAAETSLNTAPCSYASPGIPNKQDSTLRRVAQAGKVSRPKARLPGNSLSASRPTSRARAMMKELSLQVLFGWRMKINESSS
ncbi:hypothetical protein ASPFODRAFT_121111, partial [Aspergillus luchuensis CBS 106.47]